MEGSRIYSPLPPIVPAGAPQPVSASSPKQTIKPSGEEFAALLRQETEKIKFSQHATQRLRQRGISLNQDDMTKLGEAVDKAAAKGARESLVLMNNNNASLALVVSVRNRTVITAVDGQSIKDNVFTNIDSAVII